MEQCVLQCSVRMPGGGMDHQPGRLVKHDDIVIGMDDIQWNVLRQNFTLQLQLRIQVQALSSTDSVCGFAYLAVHGQLATTHPLLQPAPRKVRKQQGG